MNIVNLVAFHVTFSPIHLMEKKNCVFHTENLFFSYTGSQTAFFSFKNLNKKKKNYLHNKQQIFLGAACWTQLLGIIGYRCVLPHVEKYKDRLLYGKMNDFSLGHSVPTQESIFK